MNSAFPGVESFHELQTIFIDHWTLLLSQVLNKRKMMYDRAPLFWGILDHNAFLANDVDILSKTNLCIFGGAWHSGVD